MLRMRDDVQAVFTQVSDLSFKFATLMAELQQQRGQRSSSPIMVNPADQEGLRGEQSVNMKPMRIDVPRYEGGDPQGWIFKIQQYFDFHNATEVQRLQIAPLYFDGKALAWYQWCQKNTKIDSWDGFLKALQVRFGPSELEDYQGKLSKLVQVGSVLDYQEEFESLSNKVDGLSKSFLLSCFISGLKPSIQHEVASFQPKTLTRAMALAKVQDQKLNLKKTPPKLFSPYPSLLPTPTHIQPSASFSKPFNTTHSQPSNTNPANKTKPNIQTLSQSQIQEKREKGLFFYCDEKYSFGHKCKASVHVLITPDVEEGGEDDGLWEDSDDMQQEDQEMVTTGETTPHISFHAMSGVFLPQTLKFRGVIGKLDVSVLIDGGSTHNFIQSRVVFVLNLPITFDKQFEVMVGNGEILYCERLCSAVPIRIEKKIFFC